MDKNVEISISDLANQLDQRLSPYGVINILQRRGFLNNSAIIKDVLRKEFKEKRGSYAVIKTLHLELADKYCLAEYTVRAYTSDLCTEYNKTFTQQFQDKWNKKQ
jgi:hypothetical protein